MRTSKDTTSMQQLRNVPKQRKGQMLNGNEDLELEDFSRQRKIFLPSSNRPLPSIREQTSSIETDEDTPLFSSHACSPVFHSQTVRTHDRSSACFKPKLGYTGKRNNLQGLPDDGQLKAFNEEDYDNSSDQEDDASEAGRSTWRPSPSPKLYFVCRKATDTLAAQLCRMKCNENQINPTPGDGGRQMFKMEMPRKRSNSRGYQPQYQQVKANDRGYSHQTPSQVYPGRPSQAQANRPAHSHQPKNNQRSSLRQATKRNSRSYPHQISSPQLYPYQMFHAQANSRRYSHHRPECTQGGPRHQAQGTGRRYSYQLADTQGSSNTAHAENNQSHSYHQVKGSSPGYSRHPVNTQDCSFYQVQADSRCRRQDTQGRQHRQAEDRQETQINRMYVDMPQSLPASQRQTREPRSSAIQHFPRRKKAVSVFPNQLNDTQEHPLPSLAVRRHGRQDFYRTRSQHGGRRIGVCNETDVTRENRTFARVVAKRF